MLRRFLLIWLDRDGYVLDIEREHQKLVAEMNAMRRQLASITTTN